MHPEIEKFWNNAGYFIVIDVLEGGVSRNDLWRFYWSAVNKEDVRDWKYVGWSDPLFPGTKDALCTLYDITGTLGGPPRKTLSEKEMLKIVRLKAFI